MGQESINVSSIRNLRQWTVNEVYQYFNSYGHPRYTQFAKIILKEKINGDKLLYLTKQKLQAFGIQDQFHRMWIEQEILALNTLHRNVKNLLYNKNIQNIENVHINTLRAFIRKQEKENEEKEKNEQILETKQNKIDIEEEPPQKTPPLNLDNIQFEEMIPSNIQNDEIEEESESYDSREGQMNDERSNIAYKSLSD